MRIDYSNEGPEKVRKGWNSRTRAEALASLRPKDRLVIHWMGGTRIARVERLNRNGLPMITTWDATNVRWVNRRYPLTVEDLQDVHGNVYRRIYR